MRTILRRFGAWFLLTIIAFLIGDLIGYLFNIDTENYVWYCLGAFNVLFWKLK